MNIIEQIKALPDDKDWFDTQGHRLWIVKLKALAESHEQLLGDARRALLSLYNWKDATGTDPRVEARYHALEEAIEQAEKLYAD